MSEQREVVKIGGNKTLVTNRGIYMLNQLIGCKITENYSYTDKKYYVLCRFRDGYIQYTSFSFNSYDDAQKDLQELTKLLKD